MDPRPFKYLVIADDSAEFPVALAYAAHRVKVTTGALVILRIVDTATDNAHWVSVGEEMRAEALEMAEAMAERLAAETWASAGVQPEIVIREGDARAELRRFIDEDRDVRIVVLASGTGRDGPGPLVSSVAKGQGLGGRSVPVLIVPGTLSADEVRALAVPDPGA
ncbi:MAG: universal stress protein [Hyphomonadaceae bacterium]|nr:universal stress protein [Hyphomonadaceae bacterium]